MTGAEYEPSTEILCRIAHCCLSGHPLSSYPCHAPPLHLGSLKYSRLHAAGQLHVDTSYHFHSIRYEEQREPRDTSSPDFDEIYALPVQARAVWSFSSSSFTSLLFLVFGISQIFQNLRFSSPAPVQTMSPAGLMALHKTRASCASRISHTRSMDG